MAEACTSSPDAPAWVWERYWCGGGLCRPPSLAILHLPWLGEALVLLPVPPLPAPCLAGGFPAAPSLLLPEQKRDVYDRYGKDGLMGAGEWASGAMGH